MLRKTIRMLVRLFLLVLLILLPALILPRILTSWYSRKLIFDLQNVPQKPVAIVFGAGLWRDGSPTPVLRDRVATAAQLYFSGKVKKLLMSGDNRFLYYNEPAAMQSYALELGVPSEDIVLDYAGRRTYDTCYRARQIFKVEEVILVTQGFHIPRALFVCNALGISAIGVPADQLAKQAYRRGSIIYWNLREIPATMAALWEIYISRPLPVLGDPEPIFPLEAE
jgi:SanA protein